MKRDRENDTDPGLGPPVPTRGDTLVDLPRRRQEMRYGTDPGIPVSDSDRDLLRNLVSADRRRSNEAPNRLFESVLDSMDAPSDSPRTPVPTPISVAGPRTQARSLERTGKWLVALVGGLVVIIAVALVLRDSSTAQTREHSLGVKSVFLASRPPPTDTTAPMPPATATTTAVQPVAPVVAAPVRTAPSAPSSAPLVASPRPTARVTPAATGAPEPSLPQRLGGLVHP